MEDSLDLLLPPWGIGLGWVHKGRQDWTSLKLSVDVSPQLPRVSQRIRPYSMGGHPIPVRSFRFDHNAVPLFVVYEAEIDSSAFSIPHCGCLSLDALMAGPGPSTTLPAFELPSALDSASEWCVNALHSHILEVVEPAMIGHMTRVS
jgi:hypothetical protein